MTFEIRMAWREIRPSIKRFLFLTTAIALGVGALTGLKGFSRALDRSISRAARDLIAADLAARMNSIPTPKEVEVLESLVQKGADLTRTTETLSMVLPAKASNPILCNIRAVDPKAYPFFGKVELEPAMPLTGALSDDTAVVSRDFLVRSGAFLGETVQIGTIHFRVAAVLKSEPDRLGFGVDLGPRILITRSSLARSGLIQFGSRVSESFLYRLPPHGLDLEEARSILTSGINRRLRITDYRNPNPSISQGLQRTANFLSLIGLLALLVGCIGVSSTMHTYLQQKLDSIAVLKCLGGRSNQIMRIYLAQGLFVGVLGSAIGIGLGYLVQLAFPRLLKGLMDLPRNLDLAPGSAIQGFSIGVFITALFLIIPLLAIRKIRRVRVFLRQMPETQYSTLSRLRRDPLPLASSLILLAGVGLAASWLAESLRWGFAFLAGLLGCILVLAAAAKLLLAMLKRLPAPSLPLSLGSEISTGREPGNVRAGNTWIGCGFRPHGLLPPELLISQIVGALPLIS
jgi:putative ABC transport system permease protein